MNTLLHTPEEFMRAAIAAARNSVTRAAGGPFGACIVRDGQILSVSSNHVLANHDPTAHAEVMAIRRACDKLRYHLLEGAEIYSTTEPCPMCFASIHWARCKRIYYGTSIADVDALGFNEMSLSNFQMRELGGSPVEIVPDFLRDECLELLNFWSGLESRRTY
ncbi:MAG: nucleoside deaminase [Abitibacteriaceae bacterium]|nr:nucleoside deaminase [Abditibacteriaceae bacterium]